MTTYECGHCGFETDSEAELHKHMKSHGPSDLEVIVKGGLAIGFFVGLIALVIYASI